MADKISKLVKVKGGFIFPLDLDIAALCNSSRHLKSGVISVHRANTELSEEMYKKVRFFHYKVEKKRPRLKSQGLNDRKRFKEAVLASVAQV